MSHRRAHRDIVGSVVQKKSVAFHSFVLFVFCVAACGAARRRQLSPALNRLLCGCRFVDGATALVRTSATLARRRSSALVDIELMGCACHAARHTQRCGDPLLRPGRRPGASINQFLKLFRFAWPGETVEKMEMSHYIYLDIQNVGVVALVTHC